MGELFHTQLLTCWTPLRVGLPLNDLISSQLLHPRFAVQTADSVLFAINMTQSTPLTITHTKAELLRYLNLSPSIYTLMAETARVYSWLISEKLHLKDHCTRMPPYDWNDFKEQWKDEAANRIARGGDQYTSCYWNLASQQDSCPNWIARWFLYHKFRHNDGRSRRHRMRYRKHVRRQKSKGQEELATYGDDHDEVVHTGLNAYRDNRRGTYVSTCQRRCRYTSRPRIYYDPIRDC